MGGSCGWFPLGPDEIAAWVRRHADELPRTVAELARYPVPFRKAIVAAVGPEARVALWREHLATFVGTDSALSNEQQTLVREVIDAMPQMVGVPPRDGQPVARALEERMRELFTRRQAFEMFGTIGPPEPPEGLPIPEDALV